MRRALRAGPHRLHAAPPAGAPPAGWGALRAFLEVAPPASLALFRTSLLDAWRRLEDGDPHAAIVRLVANDEGGGAARATSSPSTSPTGPTRRVFFHYRGSTRGRGVGAGYVRSGSPRHGPEHLPPLQASPRHAAPRASRGERFHPVGGGHLPLRGLGLVQAPPRPRRARTQSAPATRASRGLPCNWLTLVDDALAEAADRCAAARPAAVALDVQWLAARGVVVRAGAAPTLGDVNGLRRLRKPTGARPRSSRRSCPLPCRAGAGASGENEQSERWHRRFAEPEGWSS